jgi:hypothetical protein
MLLTRLLLIFPINRVLNLLHVSGQKVKRKIIMSDPHFFGQMVERKTNFIGGLLNLMVNLKGSLLLLAFLLQK